MSHLRLDNLPLEVLPPASSSSCTLCSTSHRHTRKHHKLRPSSSNALPSHIAALGTPTPSSLPPSISPRHCEHVERPPSPHHKVDIEDAHLELPLCACAQSARYPLCDGSHKRLNKENGGNIQPIKVSVALPPDFSVPADLVEFIKGKTKTRVETLDKAVGTNDSPFITTHAAPASIPLAPSPSPSLSRRTHVSRSRTSSPSIATETSDHLLPPPRASLSSSTPMDISPSSRTHTEEASSSPYSRSPLLNWTLGTLSDGISSAVNRVARISSSPPVSLHPDTNAPRSSFEARRDALTKKNKIFSFPTPKLRENASSTFYTIDEVARHNTITDCWMIFNNKVYDITPFIQAHPGGEAALLRFAGKDGTENLEFHSKMMPQLLKLMYIGNLHRPQQKAECIVM